MPRAPFSSSPARTPSPLRSPMLCAPLVLSLVALAQQPLWTSDGGAKGGRFGHSVALAKIGGASYCVVGSPEDDTVAVNAGAVRVFSLALGIPVVTRYGLAAGERFGSSVAALDVNGDGDDDIAVGAPYADGGGTDAGRVVIFSSLTATQLASFSGGSAGDNFGASIPLSSSFAGPDRRMLAVGAPLRDGTAASNVGAVYLYELFPAAAPALIDIAFGTQGGEQLGTSVALRAGFWFSVVPPTLVLAGSPAYDAGGFL